MRIVSYIFPKLENFYYVDQTNNYYILPQNKYCCPKLHDFSLYLCANKSLDGPKMVYLHDPWQSSGIYSFLML